jgi:hypothetical protein
MKCPHKRIGPEPCEKCRNVVHRVYIQEPHWWIVYIRNTPIYEVYTCDHPRKAWKPLMHGGFCSVCGAVGVTPSRTDVTDLFVEV